jgi:isopropylmalate/homocitrate/citramalate synthase
MKLPARVKVVEVGPRDGLQNEKHPVPIEVKVAFVDALTAAGLPEIEASSFVSAKWIPQLGDAAQVFARIKPRAGTVHTALVPNEKGLEGALAAGVRRIAVFTAASETFNKKNTNATIAESLEKFARVIARAVAEGLTVRGYLSTCFGCPYEGAVDPARVEEVSGALFGLGCDEVSISDTIGVADPRQVEAVLGRLGARFGLERLAVHFHDTRGTALANVLAALQLGVATVDASAGGLGGCPFAPGAAGNLATEDLLYMLHRMGVETGVNIEGVVAASHLVAGALHHAPTSKYLQAGPPRA